MSNSNNAGTHAMCICLAEDVDECSTTSGICSNGQCVNFMGGYECLCDPGFEPTPQKTSCQGSLSDSSSTITFLYVTGFPLTCQVRKNQRILLMVREK